MEPSLEYQSFHQSPNLNSNESTPFSAIHPTRRIVRPIVYASENIPRYIEIALAAINTISRK